MSNYWKDVQRTDNIVSLLYKPHMCLKLAHGMKICALCLREYYGSNKGAGIGDLGNKVCMNAL